MDNGNYQFDTALKTTFFTSSNSWMKNFGLSFRFKPVTRIAGLISLYPWSVYAFGYMGKWAGQIA